MQRGASGGDMHSGVKYRVIPFHTISESESELPLLSLYVHTAEFKMLLYGVNIKIPETHTLTKTIESTLR